MKDQIITALLWFSAIGCGVMSGIYFAFSTFIMRAFGRLDAPAGIAAMNAINETILRSPFMPLFWITTIAGALLVALGLFDWHASDASAMIAGGVIYVLGMFLCTVLFNVPLNDELAGAAEAEKAVSAWSRYLANWTRWNHVRTISCAAASALFVVALVQRA